MTWGEGVYLLMAEVRKRRGKERKGKRRGEGLKEGNDEERKQG